MLTFGLLGALEVARAGRPVDLGGPKQRAVLAALLLDAGRIVSTDRLIQAVWGDDPTASAAATLQVYISNLRRVLRQEGEPVSPISRRAPGYRIDVAPEAVDTSRFVSLTDQTQGDVDRQDWRSAVSTAHQALDLWRGPLLADFVDEAWVHVARVGYDERHVACQQNLVTGLLGMGHISAAVTQAHRLFVEDALSERAAWLFMLALHRSARDAEALEVYRTYAQHLSEELGLDAGTALRDLQGAILRQDVELDAWPGTGSRDTARARAAAERTTPSPPRGDLAPRSAWQPRAAPRLLERKRELEQLDQLLDRARAGVGGALLVWGPAGIGKSSLLAHGRASAAGGGMRVLHARGAEMEREFGFGVARQLFEPTLAAASDALRARWLEGLAGHAARRLGLTGASEAVADDLSGAPSFQVLHGLYWLCAQLSTSGPTCVVIDDAQWADAASLRFLGYLLPRLVELPLAVVVGVRAGDTGPATQLLTALAADPECHVVEPAALSPLAVRDLLRALNGGPVDDAVVRHCHLATGGNPFLVGQMIAHLRERGETAVAETVVGAPPAPAVARWVQTRLRRLGEAPERLGRAVAILETASLVQAAELADLNVDQAAESWDALVEATLLSPEPQLGFTHPLVRSAVYDAIGRAGRRAGHRRAARMLARHDVASQPAAEHLLATAPGGEEWVVDHLTAAAAAAARTGAPESASAYLSRALAEPPAPDRRSDTLLALGVAELNAGDAQAVSHLQQSVDAANETQARVAAAAMLTSALAASCDERLPQGAAQLDDAIERLRSEDPALAQSVDTFATGQLRSSLELTGRYQSRMEAVRRLADDPRAPGDVLSLAALIAHKSNEPAEVVQDLARRALRTPASPLPGPLVAVGQSFLTIQALTAMVVSEAPDALGAIETATTRARETGDAFGLSASLALRGWHSLFRGDLRGVEVDATTALEATGMPVAGFFRLHSIASLTTALVEMDRVDEAASLLSAEPDLPGRITLADSLLRLARGRVRLAQQRRPEALAYFLAVGQAAVECGFDGPSLLPWRTEAALAHLAMGDHDRARDLAAAELDLARVFGAPRTTGVALRVVGLATSGPAGEQSLRDAARVLGDAGAVLDQAYALYGLGARLRPRDRGGESLTLLQHALALADQVGATRLAERAVTELRLAGIRPRRSIVTGPQSLTSTERRVADLVVAGWSDRQIAESLFTTVRQVESHLTNIFHKLNLASRDQLETAKNDNLDAAGQRQ